MSQVFTLQLLNLKQHDIYPRDKINNLESRLSQLKQHNILETKKCCIYFHTSGRWQVIIPKSKSKYFSKMKYGSIQSAKDAALVWCKENELLVTFCTA